MAKEIKDIGDLTDPNILFEEIKPGERKHIHVKRKKLPKVTPQESKFALEFVANGGNATKAYKEAFKEKVDNDLAPGSINKAAHRILEKTAVKKLIEEIQQECRGRFVEEALDAFDRLLYLSKNADSEKVRLEANIEILDRAGLKAPERVELTSLGAFGKADPNEIRDEVRRRQEERLAVLAQNVPAN